ncbi:MAG: bacterial Ig-like domain-containing protein, partial [Anaeroplasmataceae bacterium]|nr:bacterial Ig-like domain-containing protein [Anaeroplasmataceae bacterium]
MKKRKLIVSLLCAAAMLGVSTSALTSCKKVKPEEETPVEEQKQLESISVSGGIIAFTVGNDFSYEGLIVTAKMSDNTTKEVTDFTVDSSKVDKTKEGTYIVTVSYEGKTATYNVTYTNADEEKKLESISLSGGVRKFTVGSDFSYEGLIVTAKMSDNTTKEVTDFKVDSSKVDKTKEGTYTITVSYEGKTATYDVTYEYSTIIASIAVTGADDETYEYGKEYVRSSSIKVTATYTDGRTIELDSDTEVSYSLSSADEEGTKICTVKYENVSTTYPVRITKLTTTAVEDGKVFMNGTEYATLAEAFAAIPEASNDMYTITLGKGTYNENGLMYKGSATIRIVGSTDAKYGSDVIIKGHGSKMPGETGCDSKNRCLISIQGTANIILENLTLESDWYRADHSGDVQAEVLGTDTTGYAAAYNCGFKSHQDTLRTTGKAWFYGCYIEGDVDFIWMEAGGKVALYENCEIVSVWD